MTEFESRNWGEGNFRRGSHTFEGIVGQLPPNVKQAMYAAANRGLIKRGTWEGCAFNAGSLEIEGVKVESGVRNTASAAKAFNIPVEMVNTFISRWDSLEGSDEACTARLKQAILDAGLFSEPDEPRGKRIMRQTVWKSQETRMREEFEAMVEDLDLESDNQLAFDTANAGLLLSV